MKGKITLTITEDGTLLEGHVDGNMEDRERFVRHTLPQIMLEVAKSVLDPKRTPSDEEFRPSQGDVSESGIDLEDNL